MGLTVEVAVGVGLGVRVGVGVVVGVEVGLGVVVTLGVGVGVGVGVPPDVARYRASANSTPLSKSNARVTSVGLSQVWSAFITPTLRRLSK